VLVVATCAIVRVTAVRRDARVECFLFFLFQAEDGIRDLIVTGVQTCALPISPVPRGRFRRPRPNRPRGTGAGRPTAARCRRAARSEERRVGKEGTPALRPQP